MKLLPDNILIHLTNVKCIFILALLKKSAKGLA